jgi:hypothetical protein
MNARDDRALESLEKAREMRGRASSLRHVRVAGDAERERVRKRELIRSVLVVGMTVTSAFYGVAVVVRIFANTVWLKNDRGDRLQDQIHFLGGQAIADALRTRQKEQAQAV